MNADDRIFIDGAAVGGNDVPCTEDYDKAAGFDVQADFERFRQRNDIFNRSFWDENYRSSKTERFFKTYRQQLDHWRKTEGFTQKDYALRNASWHFADILAEMKASEDRREGFLDAFSLYRSGPDEKVPVPDTAAMSVEIKRVARTFGADLAGITRLDERWVYSHSYSAQTDSEKLNDWPLDLPNVIITAQAMDYDLIRTTPSALSGVATGLGYGYDALVLLSLAQYIHNLGYRAVASMNDTALMIPLAIQAGLGEYGRHGLLITKEFGPRVRLGKIFTDLPLDYDGPIRFGVREFCGICRRCTAACPPKAIPDGPPAAVRHNQSNLAGVRKWSVDAEKCFGFWAKQNSDCTICIRVCPYNKNYRKWWVRCGRFLAGTSLRRFMLWLDGKLGNGQRLKPQQWWQKKA